MEGSPGELVGHVLVSGLAISAAIVGCKRELTVVKDTRQRPSRQVRQRCCAVRVRRSRNRFTASGLSSIRPSRRTSRLDTSGRGPVPASGTSLRGTWTSPAPRAGLRRTVAIIRGPLRLQAATPANGPGRRGARLQCCRPVSGGELHVQGDWREFTWARSRDGTILRSLRSMRAFRSRMLRSPSSTAPMGAARPTSGPPISRGSATNGNVP